MNAIRFTPYQLELLDQTQLPHKAVWGVYQTADEVADAILSMKVRGAPAIGAAAAFGVVVEAKRLDGQPDARQLIGEAIERLRSTRPTAVNLSHALDQMRSVWASSSDDDMTEALFEKADEIAKKDVRTNEAIGEHGCQLFSRASTILTHCNTGSLATVGYGTALGVIRSLHRRGTLSHVFVDETRPYLQGSRLTAFELQAEGIPFDIITDSMAGYFMRDGQVDAVIVGADRVAKNGDTANKIGTYSLAILARYHKIPFYVAAPMSTVDFQTESGDQIPIEQRASSEVTRILGQSIAPDGATAQHPAFDVTPAELITAIITERGVAVAPYGTSLK